uniref:Uncharacterized protein n=1 Tax=Ananas comosus var. bracteatus TaxID=296719 RepID=A0A6V7NSG5_ANACO|nr:unnamed protein product [Ananas comosus var. bracteatus]
MVAVLWEMIFRGTDTVAVLIECGSWPGSCSTRTSRPGPTRNWTGSCGRARPAVAEPDLGSLPYLHAVLKEVLRLHPPGPLLSWARLATSDVHVDGRLVPAGTTAMVNMWAITHDPRVWPDPLEFRPDRFVGPGAAELPSFRVGSAAGPVRVGQAELPGEAVGDGDGRVVGGDAAARVRVPAPVRRDTCLPLGGPAPLL